MEEEVMEGLFKDLSDSIDQLSMKERKFIMYYILKNYYIPEMENHKTKPLYKCKTEYEYAVQKMLQEHIRVGKEVVDVLTFDIF